MATVEHRTHSHAPSAIDNPSYNALDRYLARKRAHRADKLIDPLLRHGRVLDVGCGQHATFLRRTTFGHKVGIDRARPMQAPGGLSYAVVDIEPTGVLPFASQSFDVVTCLAVMEHVTWDQRVSLVNEMHRVLRSNGQLVFTMPPPRTDKLIHVLAKLRLLSADLVEDHEETLNRATLRDFFAHTEFKGAPLRTGYFEIFMNIYGVARKR